MNGVKHLVGLGSQYVTSMYLLNKHATRVENIAVLPILNKTRGMIVEPGKD